MTAARRAGAAPSLAALILVTGISPLATDAYLAALPALQHSLGTSAAVAQVTLTAFLVGLALGQLLIGPVSDAGGRRAGLLWGSFAFAGLSALCAVAPSGPLHALVFTVNAIAVVATSVAFRLLVARAGAARLRLVGLCVAAAAAAGLLVVALLGTGRGPLARRPVGAPVMPHGGDGA